MPPAPDTPPAVRASADLLVVGSGVAGLSAAIEAAAAGLRVTLLTKDTAAESNTDKAQGGVAVALSDEDEVGLHHRDTLAAGDGLCDEAAVRVLVEEGPACITRLIDWGASFDREGSRLSFTREGAHSARRVLHARGDSTGQEILRVLLREAETLPGITYLQRTYTVDLIVEGGRCAGLLCLDEATGGLSRVGGAVLLAAGGCGQVFRETTNPEQATGDGIAMAFRAGAWVRDMEFVQFHPTALAAPGAPRFLLSEALRGEGGRLVDARGVRFMLEVDPDCAELAPRDVVARAIARRIAETGGAPVYLDLRHLGSEFLSRRFPRIHATCLGYGLDIGKDLVPVGPAAHYMMGGVATDLRGRTSLPGLYVAGEAACTGVHGANRLASNSLLEGLVFGVRAGRAAVEDAAAGGAARPADFDGAEEAAYLELPGAPARVESVSAAQAGPLAERVREIAWRAAGVLRDGDGLRRAAEELWALAGSAAPAPAVTRAGVEARNVHAVAALILRAALVREESRGAHHRTDFPRRDDGRFRRSLLLNASGKAASLPIRAAPAGPAP
jgi:L-aspartate oxidase